MPDILSAVDIAAEFRDELARLDAAAVDVMLGQWRQVEAALIADMEAFAARFEAGETLTPGQVLRMERYQALQAQVTAQLSALESAAGPLVTAGQTQAAQLGALQAATTLDALGVGITFNQLSTKATQNIVALARAGKPLAELLQPMYGQAAEGIIRELINGVALGYGPRKIARNMARDGLTDALNHLLLVSRDQYNRAARTAAFQRYEDSGVVRGYTRRCARQAGRTCIACIAMDGEFYPLSVPFAEHPQGRCTPIPAVKGVEMRSRLGSGKAWFEGLDEDAQIATMGRGRWEAWKAGELPWDKMAVKTNHPVWGPGVKVAGVPDGFKKAKRAKAVAPVTRPDGPLTEAERKRVEAWYINGRDTIPNTYGRGDFGGFGDADITKQKDAIAREISKRAGISYEQANSFVEQWAHSSNDRDLRSLSIQEAASQEFNIDLSKWQQKKLAAVLEDREYGEPQQYIFEDGYPDDYQVRARTAVRSVYDNTQESLAANGIDRVTVYRGIKFDRNVDSEYRPGDSISLDANVLESYSLQSEIAWRFAGSSRASIVVEVTVPASEVYSTSLTGVGCLNEWELVLLNNPQRTYKVVDRWQ